MEVYAFTELCFASPLYLLCLCISEYQLDCVCERVCTIYIRYECADKCLVFTLMLMPILALTFASERVSACMSLWKCVRTFHSFDSYTIVFHCGLNLIKSVLTNSNEVQYNNVRSNKAKRISFLCAEIYRIALTIPQPHFLHNPFSSLEKNETTAKGNNKYKIQKKRKVAKKRKN